MNIKFSLSTLFLFTLCVSLFAQETELDKRNGFKDIKMAAPIDSIKGAKFKKDFKEKGHHPAKLYTLEHPDYQTIGEVKIEKIEVKTYKGFIYEISVVTEKDTRLMKSMERALGKPIYNVRDESYNWAGKNLGLKFRSQSKSQLELLYTSNIVHKMMREDKDKKIDDIADDF
jgi:hypothetical protein